MMKTSLLSKIPKMISLMLQMKRTKTGPRNKLPMSLMKHQVRKSMTMTMMTLMTIQANPYLRSLLRAMQTSLSNLWLTRKIICSDISFHKREETALVNMLDSIKCSCFRRNLRSLMTIIPEMMMCLIRVKMRNSSPVKTAIKCKLTNCWCKISSSRLRAVSQSWKRSSRSLPSRCKSSLWRQMCFKKNFIRKTLWLRIMIKRWHC